MPKMQANSESDSVQNLLLQNGKQTCVFLMGVREKMEKRKMRKIKAEKLRAKKHFLPFLDIRLPYKLFYQNNWNHSLIFIKNQ